ncbi:HAD family hydrolase [Deinococcus rubellus]|uniref:Cof-type HAD-IIB family hydrolase n=1 Tax=Deinococcus rubellus TaxID=1889240 RepID=A0ABY5YJU4_9DEIO|nr:HAD family hydrolase [Deinococcus rubellus]UWX64362.1 Cof-type HAD-IIB family hydrolase [Deinococcus rubellus]
MSLPPHRPQLLAFDLDGTLILEASLTVPAATISALARLRRLGVQAAIVTGRDQPPPGVLEAARPVAVATSNGGHITIGGQVHTELRFSEAELAAVLGHQLGNARVIAFTHRAIYVDVPPGVAAPEWLARREHFPLSEAPAGEVIKVGFYHAEVASWRDELRGGGFGHLVFTGAQPPYPEFLTVTPSGADKGAALSVIAQQLGVPMERVTAFGDSDNDEAMLALAGRAVQVGRLPLLVPYAHEQVERPEVLGEYLHALADGLEADDPARDSLEKTASGQDK